MELNRLPADHAGPQKRQTEFDSPEAKLAYDAANLVRIAKEQSDRWGIQVEPIAHAKRKDDDIEALQAAIDKEQGIVRPAVAAVMAEAGEPAAELSPEQIWLGEFKVRFNALPQLHTGIVWADVERSLLADPRKP